MRGAQLRLKGARAWLLAAPLAFLALFYAWPLLTALAASTWDGARWLGTPYVTGRLRLAFLQAALSVLLTLAIALPLAWLHHVRDIKWSSTQLALHAMPFVLPVFVVVYGLQLTVGTSLSPLAAVVVAHAFYNYGFAARVIHTTLDRRPRRLEDAARTTGATRAGAFWRVSFPLLLPSLAAVALLVFLFSFASFGTVLFLGGGRVSTPETLMYAQLGGAFPRVERAAALGALQLLFSLAVLLAYVWLTRREKGLEQQPIPARTPARAWHQVAAAAALVFAMAPLAVVLAGGFRVQGAWSMEPWRALLDSAHPAHLAGFHLARAFGLSLGYAAASMLLAMSLTVCLAYARPGLPSRARAALDALTALPLGTSSLLLGFGYLLAFGAGAFFDLRGTAVVIVIVHSLVAFPFAARIVLPAFDARDTRLDDAAQLLGAKPRDVAWRVHAPLLAGPLAAAAGLAAATSLGDFGASVLLMRSDNMALSVWISRHDVPFDPLLKAQAIALAGLLAVLSAALYLAAQRRSSA